MLKSKGFYKGINLGGWLSQCDYSKDRLDNFITEPDFAKIASWGMDHVRIPIDYNVLENEDGTYKEEGFNRVKNALLLAFQYNLKVVLDLHKTAGFSFDALVEENGFFESPALQERFMKLWEELARHFGSYPDQVAFELLNEVTDQSYIDSWNALSHKCIARIRAFAPDTLILVGSYWNNSASSVKDLAAPYDDKVIYNFHCYDPLKFTHQGATWTDAIKPEERIPFSESGIAPALFEDLFSGAIQKAAENNTSLYCGEYGVIDVVSPEDALEWFKTIYTVFDKYKIARAVWSYKEMDFGISDARLDSVREEILKYL
ncbi:MAG: glycoside hydrolase family 5 protein [Lachnospiraceae bacterium]|nr:glycoside hydrolase family 5 protein [Lachnospiraceae bacterium]